MTAGAVGRYAFPKFGKKVAFLTADYAYGHEMVRGFQEAGKAFGIENLVDIRHPLGTTDFSTLLPRIQALKPDILCISNFGRDQQIALKQATDFGMKKSMKIIAPMLLAHRPHRGGPAGVRGRGRRHLVLLGHRGQDRLRQGVQRPLPQDAWRQGAVRLRRAGLCRRADPADGRQDRRQRRHRQGHRGDGSPEIRLLQGPAILSQMRSPVGAVGADHRVEVEAT